ncbi:Histidine biosynthesis bifunctional protein hisB [Diatrype stigma]|uniref:Imidazole glycerol phosphate synthase hisHF n=1 Tax=Diatrype stigma TaxID=117547 RepID=A0AAN9YL29_9PEZI
MSKVYLLDYDAGNWQSLVNAIEKLGYSIEKIKNPDDIAKADKLILPGVGHFKHCLGKLEEFMPAVLKHIEAGKPFMGICVGMQALFAGSSEDPSQLGFGLIPGKLERFDDARKSVPHIGWNSANTSSKSFYDLRPESKYYYVHAYKYPYTPGELEGQGWTVATGVYGEETFVGAVARGNVVATQFHPEKSGAAGLRVLRSFLSGEGQKTLGQTARGAGAPTGGLTRRIIACLDVQADEAQGKPIVTKGKGYDIREESGDGGGGNIRNLGDPVELAQRYYEQGADEVTFLNIKGFRVNPLGDQPMVEMIKRAARRVFVPLTIGGGIRDSTATDGSSVVPALTIADKYFEAGADKVSIGSDAVDAALEYYANGRRLSGRTAIEQISAKYGCQAVVISLDPKRVYVASPDSDGAETGTTEHKHHTIRTKHAGPAGEQHCWFMCTKRGGSEDSTVDVVELARAVEAMGAGELLLNCIDRDGRGGGFDLELVAQVKAAVRIPVIASSGAGCPAHFADVFELEPAAAAADAALGAGIFHRGEYTVGQVKEYLAARGHEVRVVEEDV